MTQSRKAEKNSGTRMTIIRPDDWHLHLRDGDMLAAVLPYTSRYFCRAVIMPNLIPPLICCRDILAYKKRVLDALPEGHHFEPLMTAYLTDTTDPDDLIRGYRHGLLQAAKLYPANATTNSAAGVTSIKNIARILEAMQKEDMPLLVHGEVTRADVDIFDREACFIDDVLLPVTKQFPALRIVVEHVSTKDAADFVLDQGENIAATVTPQHLLYNRNDLLVGGVNPHNYCLPVLKREYHRKALVDIVTSGHKRFFLGTDSAPHATHAKESHCGCAGAFNALTALSVYAHIFEQEKALDKLEDFTSINGAAFYRKPVNTEKITLEKRPLLVPKSIPVTEKMTITPFLAGQTLAWSVVSMDGRECEG